MKLEKFKLVILIMIVTFVVASMIAENAKLTGSDLVKLGEKNNISGKLIQEESEWYLKTNEEKYRLHLAPAEFLIEQKITLTEGDEWEITGFVYESQAAVVNFVGNGESYKLRTDEGEPLWDESVYSQTEIRVYKVDQGKCIGCGLSVNSCPVQAIKLVNGKAVIDADKCILCGICENGNGQNYNGCPTKAISQDR